MHSVQPQLLVWNDSYVIGKALAAFHSKEKKSTRKADGILGVDGLNRR